ncbi:sensor histidine kinase [Thalassotalea marina]|uniref:histidine kinase n=1 Tax=Thalassotalea marina TaxID=1673741 RepID=A0A919BBG2_9GAMM|nr:ATP-binding protein [Thalassotalea marina]GHF79210.1 hypothetical protein GCM10017161_02960 [Thalassotalea marina]
MTRLFLSIIVTVIGSLFLIGLGLDKLVASQENVTEIPLETAIYQQMLEGLSQELAHTPAPDVADKFTQLAEHFQLELSLDKTQDVALPLALSSQLTQVGGLILASDQQPYLLRQIPNHDDYLLRLQLPNLVDEEHQQSVILTAILYLGVCGILILWLIPLARRLFILTNAAARIGKGELNVRVNLNRLSYIYPLEASFNQMAAQIEKLMADNKLLARSLSHDIRTPMSCLRFGVEAALDTSNIEKKNTYLQRMEAELTRMEDMTSAFLSYASMERQGVNLRIQKANINQFIDNVSQHFQSLAAQHNIVLSTELLEHEAQIEMDQHWLHRAIQNLVSNAVQYANSRVLISIKRDGKGMLIKVEDDGKGIEENKLDVVFDPFVKLDVDRSREQGHFGLGLAICAKVVDWHNGSIKAQKSVALGGAAFVIYLPCTH